MNQNQINTQADGWALFDTGNGRLAIQKDDESGRFATDDNVMEYLAEAAERGGVFEAAALAHHYASIAGLDIAAENDWKLKHSARYILEDANPEKLADACGLPLGVIVSALENIGTPADL